MLASEDPRVLQVLFNVLLLFQQQGFSGVAQQFKRDHGAIVQFALEEDRLNGSVSPRKKICESLGASPASQQYEVGHFRGDSADVQNEDLLFTACNCIVDAYRSQLGVVHRTAIDCQMVLIGRQTGCIQPNLQAHESELRETLLICDSRTNISSASSRRLLLALGFNLLSQRRAHEALILAGDLVNRSAVCTDLGAYLSKAFGWELMAQCRYKIGDAEEAIANLSHAADIIASFHGDEDSWVVRARTMMDQWTSGIQKSLCTSLVEMSWLMFRCIEQRALSTTRMKDTQYYLPLQVQLTMFWDRVWVHIP